MVENSEHLRTPLKTILELEAKLRGTMAGYLMPTFVVDLPGGGGKRLAATFKSYQPGTGLSTFESPVIDGSKIYEYWDPYTVSAASHLSPAGS
jgi:lysine 2,3-aminomutase